MSTEEIKNELRALRAGRAVHAANLATRIGPHLRALCATNNTADAGSVNDPAVLRQRVITELNSCARHLPEDMATAIRASLGLHADATDPRFQGRVTWLAGRLGREDRTALRRIDEAEALLAEEISRELARRRAQPTGDGWQVAKFKVLVRLDTPNIEAYEDRRIMADRDGLDEITLGLSLPHPPGSPGLEVQAEVRYGARLIRHERPLPHRSQLVLALPRPLRAGETHDCGIVTRLGAGQPVHPHYVLTATRPYGHFRLRVRFDLDRPPRWVRRVSGEPVRMIDAVRPGDDPLDVDAVGEVHTEFERPAMYLAYGAQWSPTDVDH
jgi:hypothetical protein